MGHGTGIFGELGLTQHTHVFDTLDGASAVAADHVGREFLVAEYGQAFLERELEPVAAGDAVAGPVMEVFVADHRFDGGVVVVCCDAFVGQHVLGVEDVQALVFHRAHVEVADGDDHEAIQIQLQTKALFVPAYAVFQRFHGVLGLIQVAVLDPDLQQDLATGGEFEFFFLTHQVAGHQGEQIGGLFEWVFPLGVMAPVAQVAFFDQIAVGQQHREARLVGAQHNGVLGHDVGPVGEVGDLAETFGFALGEEIPIGHVEAHERGVLVGPDQGFDLQHRLIGCVGDFQDAISYAIAAFGKRLAVQAQLHKLKFFAVQFDAAAFGRRIASHRQARCDARGRGF